MAKRLVLKHVKKQSDSHKGKVFSKEHLQNLQKAALRREAKKKENGFKPSFETCIKISNGNRGKKRTFEQKQTMKSAQNRPEVIARRAKNKEKRQRNAKTIRALIRLAKRLGFVSKLKERKGNISCGIS